MNEATRVAFTDYLKEQVGDDEELLAKVIPDYVCLGKRTLQDNGSWLAALKRPDVELVTDPIARDWRGPRRLRERRRAIRSTSSSTPPASTPTASCGRWRSPGGAA